MTTPVRPTSYAGWASGPSGYVVEPSASQKALGWAVGQAPPASYLNFQENAGYQWRKYLDEVRGRNDYGDGSDGDLTLDGVATVLGMAPTAVSSTGSAYIAQRNLFARNLSIATGAELRVNGYVPYINDTLSTATGAIGITANGGIPNAVTPAAVGTVGGGSTGNNGTAGFDIANSLGGAGGWGGSGHSGGVASGIPANLGSPRALNAAAPGVVAGITGGVPVQTIIQGGAGGAGGGSLGGGVGGGGGGVLCVIARAINLASVAHLQAAGAAGTKSGSGTHPNAGGGGGGGAMILVYETNVGAKGFTGPVNCPGGIGGAAFNSTTGCTGMSGFPGTALVFSAGQ